MSRDRESERRTASPFVPDRNCWRTERSGRVAVLIDADAYFRAVADAIARARRSVIIVSWDIDSRTELGGVAQGASRRLGDLLHEALERNPELEIHVLNWDFALLYVFERELLAYYRRAWRSHPRLHFRLDDTHLFGASHHQKIVVVDDAVAFVGGLDICDRRWDTPTHDVHDRRRRDLGGKPYAPFHDVQIAVDGAAARALGALARERWEHATGERLAPVAVDGDPWPAHVRPDCTDVDIAIARTVPEMHGAPAVREVEKLFLDMIAAARRTIYIENQYFTAPNIADALAARLLEPDGPEVVLVVPRDGCGWLEEQTMSARRNRVVASLRAADRFGRLRVYAPVVDDAVAVNVHAKVMIVDDALLRVGSANMSRRSLAVDTECDVALAAGDDGRVATCIATVRSRLLGDHLGVPASEIAAATSRLGSLIAAIEAVPAGTHRLERLPPASPVWLDAVPSDAHIFDPAEPIAVDRLLRRLLPEELRGSIHLPFMNGAANLLALATAIAIASALDLDTSELAIAARQVASSPTVVIVLFVFGGLAFVPITLMIVATVLLLGLPEGLVVAVAGVGASALTTYGVGRLIGRAWVRRLAGRRASRASAALARRALPAVAAARFLAVSPFTVMNLMAGAARLPLREYALGTVFGSLPGVMAIGLGATGMAAMMRRFTLAGLAGLGVGGLTLLAVGVGLHRILAERPRLPHGAGRPQRRSLPPSERGALGHA